MTTALRFLAIMLIAATSATAQEAMTWDAFVEWVSTDENAEGEDWGDYLEGLYVLHQHPIDINSATVEDLMQIPLLSERQAEDIRIYVLQYGGMRTLGELLAISSIDATLRDILPLFVCLRAHETARRDTLSFKDSRHDLLTRLDVPLYRRQGERDGTYRGSGVAHRLRYNWSLGQRLSAGFGCEKDGGEPMTFRAGYDHWSGYAMVRNSGVLKTLVAGDYRMGWGEGLLINNRFAMGKSAFATSTSTGIAGHKSAAESNYLRGVAATIGGHSVTGSVFFSSRLMDAHHNKVGHATSLSTSGMHRSDTEAALRHNQRQTMAGTHLSWRTGRHLTVGATAFAERYHLPFDRDTAAYKRHAPEGRDFWGASIDYDLHLWRFGLHGETATDGHGVAMLNHLTWRHNRRLTATLSQRHYSQAFHSFMSHAMCESAVQNETGYYLCVMAEPVRDLTVRAYADLFHRPGIQYRLPHSTSGQDLRLQVAYRLGNNRIEARVQWKHKEVYYAKYVSQKYALLHTMSHGRWSLRTQAQMHHYSTARGARNVGFCLQPTVRWQSNNWRGAVAAAWFKTDDYYSRVYLTQPSLTGGLPSMYYGHGITSAATLRYNIRPWHTLVTLRYAVATYFDRDVIGSDNQAVLHRTKNDISLQVQVKL